MKNKLLYEEITYQIRGACFWVWKELGNSYKETAVDAALTKELLKRNLKVDCQKKIAICYDGQKVGSYIPDKVINDCILLEIKRKSFLTKQDTRQLWNYLKGSTYRLGLLINFGDKGLEFKRIIYDKIRH